MKKQFYIINAYLLFFILIFLQPFFVTDAEGGKAWLENVQAVISDGGILLDAKLKGAFSKDITEAVTSGAPTSFKFLVYIRKNRRLWWDKDVEEYEISNTVAFDVLKKEYFITRSYTNSYEENLSTTEWEEMVKWMTELNSVHLLPNEGAGKDFLYFVADKDSHYFMKIKAQMKCIKIPFPLNYLLAFVSLWNFDTPWVNIPLEKGEITIESSEGKEMKLR